jgi:hypothetical protein
MHFKITTQWDTDELSMLLLTVANCCPVNNKIDESHWISFTTPPINGGQNLIRQLKIKDDQILDGKNETRYADKFEMQFK